MKYILPVLCETCLHNDKNHFEFEDKCFCRLQKNYVLKIDSRGVCPINKYYPISKKRKK